MSKYIELGKVKEMVFNADISMAETEALYKSLEELPIIDIVTCEMCENNKRNTDGVDEDWCLKFGYEIESDDWCSYGERIEK